MQSNVAQAAPGAQLPSIYAFVYDFTRAAEALGLPRGWHLDTIPGTPAEPCVIVQTGPARRDNIQRALVARGFAVGTDPAAPGALYVAAPLLNEHCPACAQGARCVRHSPLKSDDPSDLVTAAAREVFA
jgi:hypothetical protein